MIRTAAAAAALTLVISVIPAAAADTTAPAAPVAPAASAPTESAVAPNITWQTDKKAQPRPMALSALYVSYAALQAYDVYSTKQALGRGGMEANPLMKGVVGNTGAFVAMKVGIGAATIVAAERLWKTNKAAAIGVMIAGNSVAAIVAARNARTLGQLR